MFGLVVLSTVPPCPDKIRTPETEQIAVLCRLLIIIQFYIAMKTHTQEIHCKSWVVRIKQGNSQVWPGLYDNFGLNLSACPHLRIALYHINCNIGNAEQTPI